MKRIKKDQMYEGPSWGAREVQPTSFAPWFLVLLAVSALLIGVLV